MSEQKKIVLIGGGSGLPVILKPLKERDVDITAIVTVADNGGSSGLLRDYVNIVPPGDIRNALATLSQLDQEVLDIFQYRFDSENQIFSNHSIGNLIIAAMVKMDGDIFQAIQQLSKIMKLKGRVLPVANEPLVLNAEFSDGTTERGEHQITEAHKAVKKLWIETEDNSKKPTSTPEVLKAIKEADMIILGPGSLFTSVLPNLIIDDVKEAIKASKAKTVYIANIMTQKGETDGFSDADHIQAIANHLGDQIVDYLLSNSAEIPVDYINRQRWNEIAEPVTIDQEADQKLGVTLISGDYLSLRDEGAFHDGQKIVNQLMEILDQ